MSILTRLNGQKDGFTPAETAIADFVLSEPERVTQLSSAQLADAIGRSQSGVIKFCQKIGFKGYQEFRIAVGQAIAHDWKMPAGAIHGSIENTDDFAMLVQKLLGSKLMAMKQTIDVNGEVVMNDALDKIRNARRIQLCGVGASSLVARDFGYKLQKLGYFVLYDADSHIQMANAASMNDQDVLIAISFSGRSLETLRAAEVASARGAQILSITGLQTNPISDLAAVQLHLVADEAAVRSSAIFTRDAELLLTDMLFIMLAQTQDSAADRFHDAEGAAARLKI